LTEPKGRKGALGADGAEPERKVASGTRSLVVGPYASPSAASGRDSEARLAEAVGLARAIDLDVVTALPVNLGTIRPATFLGKGKVEEIAGLVTAEAAGLVVMDCALSPVQQRNLERAWKAKVIDRTGLILEIFGRRARTKEGALQVELAHLNYQKSRLVRSWTHLERQRGGFGFLGGPGETQIETDRRLIQERITRIEKGLDQVKRTRALNRAGRLKVPYPTIALVGYTNAGKSTLFNKLTAAKVGAEDMLFATLDPTARLVALPHGAKAVLSDTVGFISDLPTMLVAAFRATLEDVIAAHVLLHVRDVSHGDTEAQASDVSTVMRELGINPEDHVRIIEVWNKADRLDQEERARLKTLAENRGAASRPILVSALTGEGLDVLMAAIETRIAGGRAVYRVTLDSKQGGALNWLYEEAEVLDRRSDAEGRQVLAVRIAPEKEPRLMRRAPGAKRVR
jgi:GTPase